MARNTKYEALKEIVAEALARGKPVQRIAAMVGVAEDSIYRWLKKPEIKTLLAKKRDAYREKLIGAIEVDASWQSKAWLAERLFREEFPPPTQKQEHAGHGGGPVIFKCEFGHGQAEENGRAE